MEQLGRDGQEEEVDKEVEGQRGRIYCGFGRNIFLKS